MTGVPVPRPALKKAADAHIHPAAPGLRPGTLRHAGDAAPTPTALPAPAAAPEAETTSRGGGKKPTVSPLSRPLGGATSDSLRQPGRRPAGRTAKGSGKKVELTVKIPKSLRKEFQAALKSERRDADDVVAALLRGWLGG